MRGPRTLRGRLVGLALLAALVAIGALTLVFNLVLVSSLNADADSRLRAEAAAAATTASVVDGRVHVRETQADTALDHLIWVFDGHRAVERPIADRHLQAAAAAMAGRAHVFVNVAHREERLYALPILARGRQLGTVVAAASLAAYDRTTDLALLGSLVFAGLLLAAVFAGARVFIGRALGPVREMTRLAADWSEHDLGQRFGAVMRPDELGELAGTFDGLLDRVAASMRREQRFSAELSHELRTPLARIVAEIELLERRDRPLDERWEAYSAIGRSAEQMSSILETLMAAARADAGLDEGRSDLSRALPALAGEWASELPAGIELDLAPVQAPLLTGVDEELLGRIMAPLLENAARFARHRVAVEAGRENGAVVVRVADDGPGIPVAERERVFEPGARLEDDRGHRGAGLGLPLARRLARAINGDVSVGGARGARGAELVVTLPG